MIDWQDVTSWVILLVDDEPDNLEVVADILEYRGVELTTALDGVDALAKLANFEPNLIMTDLSMPRMDGWELRVNLRNNLKYQNTPIIALSAHAMIGDKERAIAAGFDGYLTKPIDSHTLVEDIRSAAQGALKSNE